LPRQHKRRPLIGWGRGQHVSPVHCALFGEFGGAASLLLTLAPCSIMGERDGEKTISVTEQPTNQPSAHTQKHTNTQTDKLTDKLTHRTHIHTHRVIDEPTHTHTHPHSSIFSFFLTQPIHNSCPQNSFKINTER
jgi:hypothetical protein